MLCLPAFLVSDWHINGAGGHNWYISRSCLHLASQQESDVHWVCDVHREAVQHLQGASRWGRSRAAALTSSSTLNMRMRMRFWDAEYW